MWIHYPEYCVHNQSMIDMIQWLYQTAYTREQQAYMEAQQDLAYSKPNKLGGKKVTKKKGKDESSEEEEDTYFTDMKQIKKKGNQQPASNV